ncbi:hypothetical protein [Acuticoccus sp.]|uniref:hypothetical protein n=1 Tax=Acuticoccus sp. TaxID=1904378 RepID=UPI003B5171ED
MEADNRIATTIAASLTVAKGALSAASIGLDAAAANLQAVRDRLVLARSSGADRAALQTEILGLQAALSAGAKEASLGGIDLLHQNAPADYNPVKPFATNVGRSAGGTLTIPTSTSTCVAWRLPTTTRTMASSTRYAPSA